jgi:hypothetical protein
LKQAGHDNAQTEVIEWRRLGGGLGGGHSPLNTDSPQLTSSVYIPYFKSF